MPIIDSGICGPRYPQDEPWYPLIDMGDCQRFSTCHNCTRKTCPVVDNAKMRFKLKRQGGTHT